MVEVFLVIASALIVKSAVRLGIIVVFWSSSVFHFFVKVILRPTASGAAVGAERS